MRKLHAQGGVFKAAPAQAPRRAEAAECRGEVAGADERGQRGTGGQRGVEVSASWGCVRLHEVLGFLSG